MKRRKEDTMKRLAILVGVVSLLAAACARDGAVPVGPVGDGDPSPSPTPTASPSPRPDGGSGDGGSQDRTVRFEVWFSSGEHLFVTRRTEAFEPGVARLALRALLAGPDAEERRAGLSTAIPAGTRLNGVSVADGIATVDLSGEYESGGGTLSMTIRLAQVVYTITQYPSVEGVRFRLDGRPVDTFSGEGIILRDPVTRADYEDLLPPILVETPLVGQRVSSPVTISGSANVFEATVSIAILDEDGTEIVRTFTTATCGTGCRGTFSERVAYEVDREQSGTVRVFEESAEDGSPIHVVEIPVTLTA